MLSSKESMEYYRTHPEIMNHFSKFVETMSEEYGGVQTETTILTTVVAWLYYQYGADFTRSLLNDVLSHVKKYADT